MSFFGGDHNVSHFTVSERYLFPNEQFGSGDKEAYKNADKRRREQRAKLKALGFKQPYFQYRNDDEDGQAEAERKAKEFAREWQGKAGFPLEVAKGCFL